jgi:hypothetical protein
LESQKTEDKVMVGAVIVGGFRIAYMRLRSNPLFYQKTVGSFEVFPDYMDAAERAVHELTPSFMLTPGTAPVAFNIAATYFLVYHEAGLPKPKPGALGRIMDRHRGASETDPSRYLVLWEQGKARLNRRFPKLGDEIESILASEPVLTIGDDENINGPIVKATLGVFFALVLDTLDELSSDVDLYIDSLKSQQPLVELPRITHDNTDISMN